MVKQSGGAKMRRVAEGVYERNGTYIVPIWNPDKGNTGGKDWHTLGRCTCGQTHAGSTLQDARKLKRELEGAKARGRRGQGVLTVGGWAGHYDGDSWVSGEWLKLKPRLSESTNLHNDGRVRAFAREFAGRAMASITETEAQEFALQHPGTFKEVHAMFNDAVSLRRVERNPFSGLKVPTREGRKGSNIVVLKDHELEQLAAIARAVHGSYGDVFAAMILTAAWTGLRPSELFLLSLEPGDQLNYVDLDAGVVHVDWQLGAKTRKVTRPKKESQREVVLLPGAEDALRSIKSWEPGLPAFLTKRGKPFNQRTHFYYWDPVRAAFAAQLPAGHHIRQRRSEDGELGNLDFYELRHFFGTKLAHPPAGVAPASPQDIAKMMGHKDGGQLAMSIYIHTESQDAQDRIRDAWKRAS